MFQRPEGLYGSLDDVAPIAQRGHYRRIELLQSLDVGDVSTMVCVDFGMGSWGFASPYPRLHACRKAIGMDISPAAIEMSRKLVAETKPVYWQHFEAHQSDGMSLPLEDGSVDLFFSGESIEHVKFPLRFLCEIHRVLRNDGQLVVTTPNRDAINFKRDGEEYCTSPEHFWLFNYEELRAAVGEYFDVQEVYGFNGSYAPGADATFTDPTEVEAWARMFLDQPQHATGVILRLTKKSGVRHRYEVDDIPASAIRIQGTDRYLDLEFGLQGLLMDSPGQSVVIRRPPSDGCVVRFWCHRWSGRARITHAAGTASVDLYAKDPGWRNWVCDATTVESTEVAVRPTMDKNAKAENAQVLFFEAFCWRVAGKRPRPVVVEEPAAGYGFTRFQFFVTTTVFHWFTTTEGNVRGPWQPLGGRRAWTGTVEFWRRQIREMMMAHIDAIYLHCIDAYEEQRAEFFEAHASLRAEGWDVPKVAPFLDPFYLWRENPIDAATKRGKDEFTRHYIRFYEQYLAANRDPQAASWLLTVDDKLAIATWWVCSLVRNVESLQRDDVESRLRKALARRIPQLAKGIYTISTALVDPDLAFSDERVVMFSGYAYGIHSVHQGVDVWHVQAGYWDQNIRSPGYLLPRDGGKNYRRAWDAVVANKAHVHRAYVESWNEYDEGSGIYAAEPSPPFADRSMHRCDDVFSDAGDPYEYIRTTARCASLLNGRPAIAARIVRIRHPELARPGDVVDIDVVVRNEGSVTWQGEIEAQVTIVVRGRRRELLSTTITVPHDELGVVRGQAVNVRMSVRVPPGLGRCKAVVMPTLNGAAIGARTKIRIKRA